MESVRTRGLCSLLCGSGAAHCPWARAAHVSLCVLQEKWFSFAVSRFSLEPVWLLCLQSSPGGSNSTFSPWSSSDLGLGWAQFNLHHLCGLKQREPEQSRAFSLVRNKNQIPDFGSQQLEMEPISLLSRSRGCDTQESDGALEQHPWDLTDPHSISGYL